MDMRRLKDLKLTVQSLTMLVLLKLSVQPLTQIAQVHSSTYCPAFDVTYRLRRQDEHL